MVLEEDRSEKDIVAVMINLEAIDLGYKQNVFNCRFLPFLWFFKWGFWFSNV